MWTGGRRRRGVVARHVRCRRGRTRATTTAAASPTAAATAASPTAAAAGRFERRAGRARSTPGPAAQSGSVAWTEFSCIFDRECLYLPYRGPFPRHSPEGLMRCQPTIATVQCLDGPAEQAARFAALILQVGDGSNDAWQILYERYNHVVLSVIRRCIRASGARCLTIWTPAISARSRGDRRLREFSTATSVFPAKTSSSSSSGQSLGTPTAWKSARVGTQKRSLGREEPLNWSHCDLPANEPGPEERADWAEQWQLFLASAWPVNRAVLVRLSAGDSVNQAADGLHLSERKVQRIRTREATRWEEWRRG